MSTNLGINKFSVERTGVAANVPDNYLARLMYYLTCVFNVIQYNENTRLSDYKNYYYLTNEERNAVYTLALLFKPEIFINAGIFVLDNGLLTGEFGNDFYKITDERIGFHASQEIVIGGRTVKVLKIMACKNSWLQNNYYGPLNRYMYELSYQQNQVTINNNYGYNPQTTGAFVNQTNPTYVYTYRNTNQTDDFDCCRCILWTLFCLYCFPFFLIYLCFCSHEER